MYVGTSNASPDQTSTLGYKFVRNGEPVEVVNELHVRKLSNNKSFKEVKEVKSKKQAPKQPTFE
jgi:SH3-like domain-containing protein